MMHYMILELRDIFMCDTTQVHLNGWEKYFINCEKIMIIYK